MKKLALIGDFMRDVFIYGTCTRLNPEGPAPLVDQHHVVTRYGGAGNVFENFKSLGVSADLFFANDLDNLSVKTRIIANNTVVCRYDQDCIADNTALLAKLHTTDFSQYPYVVISDYAKGSVFGIKDIISKITAPVIVDPKQSFDNYTGAWCIKPNLQEFERWYGPFSHATLRTFALANNHELVIVTRGSYGVTYYWQGQCVDLPATSYKVADVTGAGDCFLAAFVYALMQGNTVPKAIASANYAAGISVSQLGTYTLKPSDLLRTVVFTNGCFDLLHQGHVHLLEESSKLGNYLVVGINSDDSVKRLKGSTRPVINQWERKLALEALPVVDKVIIFYEDTPLHTIQQLQPDIITKGDDYAVEDVVGNELAKVVIIPRIGDYSTTGILNEINRQG